MGSIEDCLLILRNYDNQRQQTDFLNFMRNKTPEKRMVTPNTPFNRNSPKFNSQNMGRNNSYPNFKDNINFNSNFDNHANFNPNPNNNLNFNSTSNNNLNFRSNFNSSYNNSNFNLRQNQNQPFSRNLTQITRTQNKYINPQGYQRNQNTEPTPMSISTRNTFNRPNNAWTQNRFRNFNNHFINRGPSNFISEELHNIKYSESSQQYDSREQLENCESNERTENFRVEASEQ